MELVTFAKEIVQNLAEQAASYRMGQSALRHLDRALWVVEKCARWAVPPPLDQDERPQPELVRPLPWIFFLTLLVALRITRESISLINLVLGKPPLRSADVVMYIQSKRRYLRTLKYQGNRMIRARSAPSQREPWYSGLQSLFEFTMCFRRSNNYGNNNTTRISNNEEVLVVKRSKRGREPASPVPTTSETTMERLIEKMMVDLNADSDEDSSFTLTNAPSLKSEDSDTEDALEQQNETQTSTLSNDISLETSNAENNAAPAKSETAGTTPEQAHNSEPKSDTANTEEPGTPNNNDKTDLSEPTIVVEKPSEEINESPKPEDAALSQNTPKNASPKEETLKFIHGERCSPQKTSPKNTIANGRIKYAPSKKRGLQTQRRDGDTNAENVL